MLLPPPHMELGDLRFRMAEEVAAAQQAAVVAAEVGDASWPGRWRALVAHP